MRRSTIASMALLCALSAQAQISAPGYKVEQLVKPSSFHGVHGLAFDANGQLYAGSVVGERVYRVDAQSGEAEVIVAPPEGMADDLAFGPNGVMAWTGILQGVVRARTGAGPIRVIAENLPGANSIAFNKENGRLFMAQVFLGDGLWELDPDGVKAPRNILKDIGGLNGFDIGPDGWIYGPLWFKKQVVKVNPDNGELKIIAEGFAIPAAANFDSNWNLYVLDAARGEVVRVDIKTGVKRVVAKLAASLDNLAIDAKDRIFVSNMADNAILEVNPANGRVRTVIKGAFATPVGLAAATQGGREIVYVADVFALRTVDGKNGRVADIERSHAAGSHIEYPIAVSVNERHVLATMSTGEVAQFGRDGVFVHEWKGLGASSAVQLNNGDLLVAQGGALTRIDAQNQRRSVATELGVVQGLAVRGADAYVADLTGGRIVRVRLDSGEQKVLATGLKFPKSIALTGDGRILTVEFARQRLLSVDPATGAIAEVASNLPIGLNGPARPEMPIGLTVGASGAIYIASDAENALYKLTKRP